MKLLLPSPLEMLPISPHLNTYIKRDDLIHPTVSGNKYRKLKGYLEGKDIEHLITFGGPFSNHVHASAAYCYEHGIACSAYIRGLDADLHNPTLSDLRNWNCDIHLLSRAEYKNAKEAREEKWKQQAENEKTVLIPEGGWGEEGFAGLKELAEELILALGEFDHVILPVGSATTLIGLAKFLPNEISIVGIRAVKDATLDQRILSHVPEGIRSIELIKGYEWGGFAKYDDELLAYMKSVRSKYHVPLDFIYNAKAFYAFESLVQQGFFDTGSTVVYLHTGGLQGNRGLDYLRKK